MICSNPATEIRNFGKKLTFKVVLILCIKKVLFKCDSLYVHNFESLRLKIAINKSLLGLQLFMHTISKHDVKG